MSRAAHAAGAPRSALRGRPTPFAATITQADGNVWGTIEGQVASPWSGDDLAVHMAVEADRLSRCPCGCGHRLAETVGDDNFDAFYAKASVCQAGKARDRLASQLAGEPGGTHGLLIRTWREDD